jgi:hypothetical protein
MEDHATLLITDICRILVPYNIHSLKKEVRKIYDRKMFSALFMRFDDIEKLPLHDQVRELFRVYHLAYPNLDIDHDTYMGLSASSTKITLFICLHIRLLWIFTRLLLLYQMKLFKIYYHHIREYAPRFLTKTGSA